MSSKRGIEEDSINSEDLIVTDATDNIVSNHIHKKLKDRETEELRTSSLSAPNILLEGHTQAVFSIAFDSLGQHLASGSLDRSILLWDVYNENKNYYVLNGHKNGITQVCWSKDNKIISSSADKTIAIWDANKGMRIRKFTEHSSIVNSCTIAKDNCNIIASGSDDTTVILYDIRSKDIITSIPHHYQITSVCLNDDGTDIYTGGIDNIIRRFDLRSDEAEETLALSGHQDSITGLSLSPDNNFILSNAMDHILAQWDTRPYVLPEQSRCVRTYEGFRHGAEKVILRCSWSPDMKMVACGSSDRVVHIWDTYTAAHLYYLPGHKGSVNDVLFHPVEPIVASCSSDKSIFIGELNE